MKKILYVRSGPYQVNINSYNLQEVGLATALLKYGYQTDIVYYSKDGDKEQELHTEEGNINVLWCHGIKLMRSGIYRQVLDKNFLSQYDFAICSEYSQIMSILLSRRIPTYIYNGPYYNLFKIPFVEPIYDALFCKYINMNVKHVFCKTKMSENYLNKKGIRNTSTVGVGLDVEKFKVNKCPSENAQRLLSAMKGKFNFLYIGSISKRKNVLLIIQSFSKFIDKTKAMDCQLVLVGKSEEGYKDICLREVPDNVKDSIVWHEHIDNAETKFIYQAADVFLLPSVLEIYGMVLLEAMYFGLPVISSHTAGADLMIENGNNGIIIDEYDCNLWAKAMTDLYRDSSMRKSIGEAATKKITNEYMWSNIAENMKRYFK